MLTESERLLNPEPAPASQERAGRAYRDNARASLEEKFILENLSLVQQIVRKIPVFPQSAMDRDDLVSAGTLGLVKAARTFDPDRHTEFRTYAYILVRGAIIDELRRNTFVPTGAVQQFRALEEAYARFAHANGRPPGDEELAASLGISVEQLYRTLKEARRQHFLSIHGLSNDEPALAPLMPVDKAPGPDAEAARRETAVLLAQAISELPARDRRIVVLYYERDLTMKEISLVMDITESRVSQLHASALFKLSMKLRSCP